MQLRKESSVNRQLKTPFVFTFISDDHTPTLHFFLCITHNAISWVTSYSLILERHLQNDNGNVFIPTKSQKPRVESVNCH